MVLIGNKQSFAIELVPVQPSWEINYASEKAAWAGTAIWVDGNNLCDHRITGSSSIDSYLYVPLAPIADWIVRSFAALQFEERAPTFPTDRWLHQSIDRWWKAPPERGLTEDQWMEKREEWWSRHFLRIATEGSLLPDLAFTRDDEQLAISWDSRWTSDLTPDFLFPSGDYVLPWEAGVSVLRDLVSQVGDWMRQAGLQSNFPWLLAVEPFDYFAVDAPLAISLFTGRSLDAVQDFFGREWLASLLIRLKEWNSERDPAGSPAMQILRDLSPAAPSELGSLVREVDDLAATQSTEEFSDWMQIRAVALDAAKAGETLEDAGKLAANEIRRNLSLNGTAISNVEVQLLRPAGIAYSHSAIEAGRDRMILGGRHGGRPVVRTLLDDQTATSWGQRFEACRALGHLLLDPLRSGAIGAASGPFAQASRRRRSGAFAAELLLPESAIARASNHELDGASDDEVFQTLLREYGVGARTAAHQLYNSGWLSSSDVRDYLIDRFSSEPGQSISPSPAK